VCTAVLLCACARRCSGMYRDGVPSRDACIRCLWCCDGVRVSPNMLKDVKKVEEAIKRRFPVGSVRSAKDIRDQSIRQVRSDTVSRGAIVVVACMCVRVRDAVRVLLSSPPSLFRCGCASCLFLPTASLWLWL
jgi:hypothetical protein